MHLNKPGNHTEIGAAAKQQAINKVQDGQGVYGQLRVSAQPDVQQTIDLKMKHLIFLKKKIFITESRSPTFRRSFEFPSSFESQVHNRI